MQTKSRIFRNPAGALLFAAATFFLISCENYFGEKTELDFIDKPEYQNRPVAYVPIQPVWSGFIRPVDVSPGFDELIYVVDEGAEEIISFDVSGKETGRMHIPGVKAVAQDRTLDLMAVGTFDTIISGSSYTLSALYRIDLKSGSVYGLKGGAVVKKIVHPFYYKSSFTSSDADVRFNDVAFNGDNTYYATRSGPRNFTTQIGGPDDAVLVFNADDKYITPVTVTTSLGVFSDYFKKPSAITTLSQPPQSFGITSRKDFVVSSLSSSTTLKVIYITYTESAFGSTYEVKEMVVGDTSQADGFLYEPGKFESPAGLTYTGDGTNYIFVADAGTDSLYQFTSAGYEGVRPPPGSQSKKYIKASFGGQGTDLSSFSNPSGVAYLREIVYVADAENKRVLRYKLTTDFD